MERPSPEPGLVSSSRGRGWSPPRSAPSVRPGPVVVDADDRGLPGSSSPFGGAVAGADRDLGLRPFAGIVDQIADDLLEVLLLALEAGAIGHVADQLDAALAVEAAHHPDQPVDHRLDLGDDADDIGLGGDAGAVEIVVDLPAHQFGLLDDLGRAGSRLPRASLMTTLSGVFSAWARLPTWVRARSTTS